MGGRYSRSTVSHVGYQPNELQPNKQTYLTPPQVQESTEMNTTAYGSNEDDFYDGIPRYARSLSLNSRSVKSKQAAAAKVSGVSSRLGTAASAGLGKVVEVLDTIGSSVISLNTSSSFDSRGTIKGNKISILAFEVANTIVKGFSLMQSLSKRNIQQLKKVVLPSEGVQHLVSNDLDELLRIVAADKREELKIFSGEVIRFGKLSNDYQWHNLEHFFDKRPLTPYKPLQEEAELGMEQFMTLVLYTADLYHEFNELDRLEQDYWEQNNPEATQRGDSLAILTAELKSKRKQVRNLKKKSLWSKSMGEVVGTLVDIVMFLNTEIHNVFGSADDDRPLIVSVSNQQRLGPAGLALQYANIVIQIDTVVARSSSMPPNLREILYQSLPPSIISSLRSKLQSFHAKKELTVTEIKDEMEKTLQWLVPTATNTAKAHHSFGWVGEWANIVSEVNQRPTGPIDVIRIQTLHHADKEKMDTYILDLVLWLNHLVSQSKVSANGGGMKSPINSPIRSPLQETAHT